MVEVEAYRRPDGTLELSIPLGASPDDVVMHLPLYIIDELLEYSDAENDSLTEFEKAVSELEDEMGVSNVFSLDWGPTDQGEVGDG